MALQTLFVDGFDHYATADILQKYTLKGATPAISTTARNGGQSLLMSGYNYYVSRSLPGEYRTIVIGFALHVNTAPTVSIGSIVGLHGGSLAHLLFRLNDQMEITVYLSGSTFNDVTDTSTVSGTFLGKTTPLTVDAWNYIEIRAYIDDTAGEVEIRVNGASLLSVSGVDTQYYTDSNYVNAVYLSGAASSVNTRFDDFYIRGDTVLTAGGFLGDCKVITSYPDAAGSSAQLTPTGAATNHEATDDPTPDGDTTYVESATATHRDLYSIGNIAQGGGTIHAVQVSALSKKTDTGYRAQKLVVKSGATTDVGPEQALSTDYVYKTKLYETDPNTGAAWLESNLDSVEAGLEVA